MASNEKRDIILVVSWVEDATDYSPDFPITRIVMILAGRDAGVEDHITDRRHLPGEMLRIIVVTEVGHLAIFIAVKNANTGCHRYPLQSLNDRFWVNAGAKLAVALDQNRPFRSRARHVSSSQKLAVTPRGAAGRQCAPLAVVTLPDAESQKLPFVGGEGIPGAHEVSHLGAPDDEIVRRSGGATLFWPSACNQFLINAADGPHGVDDIANKGIGP